MALIASAAGGMDIEEVAHQTPEKILAVTIHPAAGLQALPGARARLRAGTCSGTQIAEFQALVQRALPALHGEGPEPRRDQPADRHQGRRAGGARCQDQHRRERAVPAPGARGAARREPGRPDGAACQRARPELRLPRRRHRLHGQRRGTGDGDHGPHQAARRRRRRTSSTSAAAPPASA